MPCIETYQKVDLRTITLGVPPQEVSKGPVNISSRLVLNINSHEKMHFMMVQVLTKDSVTVSVDAVVYYRVSNAIVSVTNVKDTHHSTKYADKTNVAEFFINSRSDHFPDCSHKHRSETFLEQRIFMRFSVTETVLRVPCRLSLTHQLIFINQNKRHLIELAGRGHCRLGNKSGKSRNV